VVFIVDKNGQLIAASGGVDNLDDFTRLAHPGNIAATGGMAKLLKENGSLLNSTKERKRTFTSNSSGIRSSWW
jgi:hypothetical protein